MVSGHWQENLEFLSIKVADGPLTSRLQHVAVGDTVLVGRKPVGTLLPETPAGRAQTCIWSRTGTESRTLHEPDPRSGQRMRNSDRVVPGPWLPPRGRTGL